MKKLIRCSTGLSELGTEVIKAFFVPKIRPIGDRIEAYLDGAASTNADRIAATHIKQLIIVSLRSWLQAYTV